MTHKNRRRFITAVGAGTFALAGCFYPVPTGPGPGSGPGLNGHVPGGGIPSLQEYTQNDATHVARTTQEIQEHAQYTDGRIVWLPNDSYDATGTSFTLEGITLASGRSPDSAGAVIYTTDEGADSHTWSAGDGHGLITVGTNATLSGVELQGPAVDNYDHHVLGGYFPFAPQDRRSARDQWRKARYSRGVTITGDNATVSNCDIRGFSVQAISVGDSNNSPQNVTIAYNSLTQSLMTSLGYAVDVRHGDPTIYRCYMDATRHSLVTSGMADANYHVLESTFGPWTLSHPIDSHRVGENTSGSSDPSATDYRYRAGGTLVVKDSLIIANRVPDLPFINFQRGNTVPHVRIRGVPLDGFYLEGCRLSHGSLDDAIDQSQDGIPGRVQTDQNGFANINVGQNEWGVAFESLNQIP